MSDNIIDINEQFIKNYIESKRPPVDIRPQLDLGYSYVNGIAELYEIRPIWSNPSEYAQHSYAKIKFIKSKKIWKLYWMRASGKWESYEPLPASNTLQEILECIEADAHGCFHG